MKKEQILNAVLEATMQRSGQEINLPSEKFEDSVKRLCRYSSVQIILKHQGSVYYLGPRKLAKIINANFGGKILYSFNYYWHGIIAVSNLLKLLPQNLNTQILCFNVDEEKISPLISTLQKILTSTFTAADDEQTQSACISGFKLCYALRRKYQGKVIPYAGRWIWLGNYLPETQNLFKVCSNSDK